MIRADLRAAIRRVLLAHEHCALDSPIDRKNLEDALVRALSRRKGHDVMTGKFIPVSLWCKDPTIPDATAIREANEVLEQAAIAERGYSTISTPEYRLQPLDVAQIVDARTPEASPVSRSPDRASRGSAKGIEYKVDAPASTHVETPAWEPPGGTTRAHRSYRNGKPPPTKRTPRRKR